MKTVEIYTDGACRGNPGPGGWAAILVWGQREKELTDGEALTTNNRMELLAAIRGLEALKERCRVVLYSDSKYLVDAVTLGWAVSWKKKGWKKADGSHAKNEDLWDRLLALLDAHEVEMRWVKGHNGHGYNERCDALATASADALRN